MTPEQRIDAAPAVQGEPVAYAVFSESGNIRIWCADPIQVETLRQQYGEALQPLYAAPQPAEQKPSTHWSHDNPGLADQYRAEALAARRSVGFGQDAYDVAPADIAAAIESLARTASDVAGLVEALEDIGNSWHGVNTELERYMRNVARRALAAYRKQGGEA